MKWLWFAIKNVLRNRRRSLVTIIIAAVGTAYPYLPRRALAMAARD